MDAQLQVFGKYKLIKKIATGGMAEVFLAQLDGPAGFQKSLVVKRILPHLIEDESFVEMFLNEARLAALLNHPNIVTIFDLGEADGTYFIAMEYIDGPNLRSLNKAATRTGEPMPFECAAKIIALACEGLGFAHDFALEGRPLGLIHRDISPDNIMMSRNGAVKLVDFGIAKAANQSHLTKTGTLKGKISYMPPEQLRGEPLDRRADIFALGVVLYELVAGARPFDSSSEVATMQSILFSQPAPLSERRHGCPEALWKIVERALEKDRDQRYPDCRAMQRDLESFLLEQRSVVGAWQLAEVVEKLLPASAAPAPSSPPAFDGGISPQTNKRRVPKTVAEDAPTVMGAPTVFSARTEAAPRARRQEPAGPPARKHHWALAAGLAATAIVGGLLVFLALDRTRSPAGEAVGAAPVAQVAGSSERTPPPVVADAPVAVAEQPQDAVRADAGEVAVAKPDEAPTPVPTEAAPVQRQREASAAAKRQAKLKAAKLAAARTTTLAGSKLDDPAPAVAAEKASLVVHTRPACLVQVDGGPARRAPAKFEGLAPGEHLIKISSAEERISRTQRIQLAAGEERSEEIVVGSGKLSLWVRPWANVEVDGKAYGPTPLPNKITLFEGEHQVRLVNPELNKSHAQTVTIRAGADEVIRVNLER